MDGTCEAKGEGPVGTGGVWPGSLVLAGGCTHIWVRPPAWQKQSRGTEPHAWHSGDSKVSPSGRKDQSRATELSCTAPALGVRGGQRWAGITRPGGRMVPGRDTQETADPGAQGCRGTGTEAQIPGMWMLCNHSGQGSPGGRGSPLGTAERARWGQGRRPTRSIRRCRVWETVPQRSRSSHKAAGSPGPGSPQTPPPRAAPRRGRQRRDGTHLSASLAGRAARRSAAEARRAAGGAGTERGHRPHPATKNRRHRR